MQGVKFLRSLLSVPSHDLQLVQCQLAAFSKHIPILYGIVIVNTILLAATHLNSAPPLLSAIVPSLLCFACFLRVIVWLRRRGNVVTGAAAVAQLRMTMWLVAALSGLFVIWSLSLFPYGDDAGRFHVAFFVAITVISCMFCLMHLNRAALLQTAIVVVPFEIFFCLSGQAVFVAIAINFLLVVAGLIVILQRNYADFEDLIVSKRELLARQIDLRQLSVESDRLASLDSLTGLPNRRSFLAALQRALEHAERTRTCFAVALIDLDGFKGVNEAHGHATGDRLLAEAGARLQRFAGPKISVARLGGDEFGAIMTGNPEDADVLLFGRELCTLLKGSYLVPELAVQISASAGVVTYPSGGVTAEQLFERADYALYHSKQARLDEPTIFSHEHQTIIRQTSQIEQALRQADLEQEMWLAFQPINDVVTHRTHGYEALARWNSSTLGAVRPDIFIPIAERARVIGPLTELLLAKTLRASACWPATYSVSFNLSAQDVTSRQTMAAVQRAVEASGIAPSRVEFEITETAVMRDFDQALTSLAALRSLGARIALDDFGTGFSSLSHVHRLKPDRIKIDRSFVTDIEANKTSRDIVRTIVDLCRTLRLDCVVEGVETEEQKVILMMLGCRLMQGYLFGKPMPLHDLVERCFEHASSALPALTVFREAAVEAPARRRLG